MEEAAKMEKKALKKDVNHMAWGLIWYTIISIGLMLVVLLGYTIVEGLRLTVIEKASEDEIMRLFDMVCKNDNIWGLLSNVGVILGVLFLCFYFYKFVSAKEIFKPNRKMTGKSFWKILCVFMGAQLVCTIGFIAMESGFNVFGYSVLGSMESATADEEGFFMVLYVAIVGPIVEELVYRGFVMSSIKKYGKVFAIVVSSVLFGVMHANLPQVVFAVAVGLVLGYVAMEYSIGWAILLHIINNGVFGELLSFLIAGLSEAQQVVILWIVQGGFSLLAVFLLWKKRKDIKAYVESNKPKKKSLHYAFTSVGMMLFVMIELVMAFSMVEKLAV